MCKTCNERFERNPLRILDCKEDAHKLTDAPEMLDYLCEDCRAHFAALREYLDALGVAYSVDPRIVRGLDYYTKTVFEIVTPTEDGELTVCGGGRYDGLIEQLGGPATPGVGFGMGVERMLLVQQMQGASEEEAPLYDVFVATMGQAARLEGMKLVRGINAEGCADMTRKQIDSLVEFVKTYRAKGLAYVTYTADGGVKSSFNKFLTPEFAEKLRERFAAKPGDILFFVADRDAVAFQSLGALRIEIARRRGLIPEGVYDLFWVTEFPLFEYSEEEGRYVAMHHPFTSWMPEDEAYLENEKDKVRARAYDLVMNGIEMGSGSIRIHRSDMQAKMFKMIGLSDEEAQHRFGFLTDAFKYGTPPHGGFAFGLDRLSMILTGSDSLRDVVAFPKAQGANCLMMETPADVNPDQLEALKIKVDLGE